MSFASFQSKVQRPFFMQLFMLQKLPAAWFSGVQVRQLSEAECVVTIPYRWSSRNPFRSTYFACQAMAAEMSTGLLAMAHLQGRNPSVSMLVTRVESFFVKKASETTYFTCGAGHEIRAAIENAIATGQGQTISVSSTGRNRQGDIISEFTVEWSFKARTGTK